MSLVLYSYGIIVLTKLMLTLGGPQESRAVETSTCHATA